MLNEIFVLTLTLILAYLLRWGFRTLPGEEWQILCCIPAIKGADGNWNAVNLTYYGFFNAVAYTLAVALFIMLTGSLQLPFISNMAVIIVVLGVCMPASRLFALAVEGKRHTFTVGGAFFAGLFAAPAAILLVNITMGERLGFDIPALHMLAAMSIAYTVGEGVGRLACISFGCCYGKPLSACHPLIGRVFARWHFVFSGETKKIAYAHQLDGQKVLPIQGLTAALYCASGLLGCYLFLKGFTSCALIETLIISQGWRILSEFFRADYRGTGRITAYQVMAVLSVVYVFFLFFMLPVSGSGPPDLTAGLKSLWDPCVILCLGALWLCSFIYTGRSRVTGATVHYFVVKENI
ncbi:MAG: prolipoprotein diacylglyceryl transferase family protein [Pseudomonadota bacterium]